MSREAGKSFFNNMVLTSELFKMKEGQTFAVASAKGTIYFECIKVIKHKAANTKEVTGK